MFAAVPAVICALPFMVAAVPALSVPASTWAAVGAAPVDNTIQYPVPVASEVTGSVADPDEAETGELAEVDNFGGCGIAPVVIALEKTGVTLLVAVALATTKYSL